MYYIFGSFFHHEIFRLKKMNNIVQWVGLKYCILALKHLFKSIANFLIKSLTVLKVLNYVLINIVNDKIQIW